MILDELSDYIQDLPEMTINAIEAEIDTNGIEHTIEANIAFLNCKRVTKSGMRIIQTIDYPYKIYLSKLEYILSKIEDNSEYKERIIQQHKDNIAFELDTPPTVYDKKKGLTHNKVKKSRKQQPKLDKPSAKERKLAAKVKRLNTLKFNVKLANNE